MGSNGTHKNKKYLSKKISAYSHWKVHLKKSTAPLKSKKFSVDEYV